MVQLVKAPFECTCSLPSKGVRAQFIDALNIWAGLRGLTVAQNKDLIDELHTASLM